MKGLLVAVLCCGLAGCSDGDKAIGDAYDKPHVIRQFSDGKMVGEWRSASMPDFRGNTNCAYFRDVATGGAVSVCGVIQVVQVKP